ncbi:hypothetical protein [Salimicrobium flavidum]|uniref:Uncharacterized protein n=1 Tax=Salimicrobium flavidum TaxID=570947 RepID=A0A1N7KHE6_9BACI|nr:hypothetical protein [Salimicrobium flavidum]SIS61036.1 hypothetical protein SAMN05421687_1127 [Salimicrobium flavidum]
MSTSIGQNNLENQWEDMVRSFVQEKLETIMKEALNFTLYLRRVMDPKLKGRRGMNLSPEGRPTVLHKPIDDTLL